MPFPAAINTFSIWCRTRVHVSSHSKTFITDLHKIQSWFQFQTVVCEKLAEKTAHQDHDVCFEDFLLSLVVVLGLKFSLIQQLIAQLCCSSRTSVVENSGISVD